MKLIAKHLYFKTERKTTSIKQYEVEHERYIYLYEDKVVTQFREFKMEDVMDFSYREMGGQHGILYLHTVQGVFSYFVKSSPQAFIEAYDNFFK